MTTSIIINLLLGISLITFGIWLGKLTLNKYKLKSYYDFQLLGASICSLIIGVYCLINLTESW